MIPLGEGIYATIQALRLMKRKKVNQDVLVANLQGIRKLLRMDGIYLAKCGDSLAIYVHVEEA